MNGKISRRIPAILAAAVLLAVTLALPAAAYTRDEVHTPVILVPGYTGSELYLNYGEEDELQAWLRVDDIMQALQDNIGPLLLGAAEFAAGDMERLVDVLGRETQTILEQMRMNPDGSSVYDLTVGYSSAEESNNQWLIDNMDGAKIAEPEIMAGIAETIGQENIFNFHCDFRMGNVDCAKALRKYVEEVKVYTGSDQVSLLGISHGGGVVGSYLSLYGTEGDLDHVVMNVPALAGATIACDAFSGDIAFDEALLMYYVECGFMWETSFEWLMSALNLDFVDDLLAAYFDAYAIDIVKYWGSMWDFISPELYEDLKAKHLDPVENAALIEKSDSFHYEIVPNYGKAFRAAQQAGVTVSIMSSTGASSVGGMQANSDAIILTGGSSGAKCAPFGQRFADGYTGTGSACTDPAHHHISPSMEIDATHAYLPENTWFVEGQFHGMSYKDPYTQVLLRRLLLSDDLKDIYSDPAYPQFERSHNPKDAIHVTFDSSLPGYLSAQDRAIVIRNLSAEYPLRVNYIECGGMRLDFDYTALGSIAPGEAVTLPFTGTVPDAHMQRCSLTVYARQTGSVWTGVSRTFDFTVLGGQRAAYDNEKPYAPLGFDRAYDNDVYYKLDWLASVTGLRTQTRKLGRMLFD